VLAAMSGMEREYIRDRTLEGHEFARKRGKTIGGAGVNDNAKPAPAPPCSLPSLALGLMPSRRARDVVGRRTRV
jgi:hypothetical protein